MFYRIFSQKYLFLFFWFCFCFWDRILEYWLAGILVNVVIALSFSLGLPLYHTLCLIINSTHDRAQKRGPLNTKEHEEFTLSSADCSSTSLLISSQYLSWNLLPLSNLWPRFLRLHIHPLAHSAYTLRVIFTLIWLQLPHLAPALTSFLTSGPL